MIDNVTLMMRAHRCTREQAEQICADIASGKRKVASSETLCKRARVGRASLTVLKTGEVRPIGRVTRDGRSHITHPAHPEHSNNGS